MAWMPLAGLEAVRRTIVGSVSEGTPFVTYSMADGSLIWGEYTFVTSLDGFEERDDEIKLVKRTYTLVAEEELVLPDPYPITDDDDDPADDTI